MLGHPQLLPGGASSSAGASPWCWNGKPSPVCTAGISPNRFLLNENIPRLLKNDCVSPCTLGILKSHSRYYAPPLPSLFCVFRIDAHFSRRRNFCVDVIDYVDASSQPYLSPGVSWWIWAQVFVVRPECSNCFCSYHNYNAL